MIEYTQSSVDPGNCWQTVIASLLDIDPGKLPDQTQCDLVTKPDPNDQSTWGRLWPTYNNELGAYLRDHHNLFYSNVEPERLAPFIIRDPGWHAISGDTVRTPVNGCTHVVVGRYGKVVWDPHPSRAGLTKINYHAFLVPYPEKWLENSRRHSQCHCPECGGFTEEYIRKCRGL